MSDEKLSGTHAPSPYGELTVSQPVGPFTSGYSFVYPPSPRTMNKVVACTAFPKQNVEKVIKGGIAMIDKKVNLQELTVVLSSDSGFNPGQKVFVRGDAVVQNWVKEVFTVEGKEFILVPETAIMVVTNG